MTPDYRPYVRVGDAPKSDQPWPLPPRSLGEARDIEVANEMNAVQCCGTTYDLDITKSCDICGCWLRETTA